MNPTRLVYLFLGTVGTKSHKSGVLKQQEGMLLQFDLEVQNQRVGRVAVTASSRGELSLPISKLLWLWPSLACGCVSPASVPALTRTPPLRSLSSISYEDTCHWI